MMKLVINGEEKKIKFGYNCFCDTDLMDRVNDLTRLFQEEAVGAAAADEAVSNLGKIKELFCVVRKEDCLCCLHSCLMNCSVRVFYPI